MIGPLGRLAVRLAHEVIEEWRRLDGTPLVLLPSGDGEMSCTMAVTERAAAWDYDRRPPVSERTGFGR